MRWTIADGPVSVGSSDFESGDAAEWAFVDAHVSMSGSATSSCPRSRAKPRRWQAATRRAGKRPDRIQRRTVSGFLQIFSVASATDNI